MANIAIVGGGVAGLSAGIEALRGGHEVTVYEKHTRAGGNLTGWDRGGYHIDNCLHWLTGTNQKSKYYRTFRDIGALGDGVPVYQPDTLYTYEEGGRRLSLSQDFKTFSRDLLAVSQKDEREVRALLAAVRGGIWYSGIAGKKFSRRATPIERAIGARRLTSYLPLSTGDLADRFRDPLLRGFLSSFLGKNFGAAGLISVFSTFCSKNGGLPAGGSVAMAERILARFLELGGTFRAGCPVSMVNVEGRRAVGVTLEDGSVCPADAVILATDPRAAFGPLLPARFMPRSLARRYKKPQFRRFSSYHVAFAVDADLVPFRGDYIFPLPREDTAVLHTNVLILREFSHEKSFSPVGKTVLQAMVFCNEADARALISLADHPDGYRETKRDLATRIERVLGDKFPSLAGKLSLLDVWTPATYRRYTGAEVGSYMSFTLPAKTLPSALSPRLSRLTNVFLASQWQTVPGGLPLAASSGIRAARAASAALPSARRAAKSHSGPLPLGT